MDAHRARRQPVRHRARRRVRRDPRRGDELRRPTARSSRATGSPPSTCRTRPAARRRSATRSRCAARCAAHPPGRATSSRRSPTPTARSCRARWPRSSCAARHGVTTADDPPRQPAPARSRGASAHGWILEVLVGVGHLPALRLAARPDAPAPARHAFRHAQQIVDAEKFLGLYHEYSIQQAFLHARLVHVVLEHLVRHHPLRDAGRRAGVAVPQGAGALRALAQHARAHARRLDRSCSGRTRSCRRGSCPRDFGFVDTAADFFNFGPQVRVHLGANGQPSAAAVRAYGNLFAAMPSLHVGWSTWSALAVWPLLRRTWAKVLWALYPVSIFFCIVVTANHWILDAVGGWVVLAIGYLGARGIEWVLARRRHRSSITGLIGSSRTCGRRTAPAPAARTARPRGSRTR